MNLSAELAELVAKNTELKQQLEEQITINSTLTEKVSQLSADIAGLNKEIVELNTTIKMRDEQLALKQSVIESLQKELQTQKESYEAQISDLNEQITALNDLINRDISVAAIETYSSYKSNATPTKTTSPKWANANLYIVKEDTSIYSAKIIKNGDPPSSYLACYDLGSEFRWSYLTTIKVVHAGKTQYFLIRNTTKPLNYVYTHVNMSGSYIYLPRYVDSWLSSGSKNKYVAYLFSTASVTSYYVYDQSLINTTPLECSTYSATSTSLEES